MRSFSDVLVDSNERQNLKSGAVIIATLCALIVIIFTFANIDTGLGTGRSEKAPVVKSAVVDD